MSDQPPFDQRQLRDALSRFVTGVTIVTTRDAGGKAHGVTANSFSAVSLDPPLVLWSQAVTSRSHPAFRDGERFAVHVLADDQVALANQFARSRDDKFDGVACRDSIDGVPLLDGAAATFECVRIASFPGGDHVIFLGRVERIEDAGRRPLAFGGGRYLLAYPHEPDPQPRLAVADAA